MKRLDQMTREELVNLDEEGIKQLTDLECMHAGAPLMLIPLTLQDVPEIHEPDMKIYEVCNLKFTDEQEAEQLATFINSLKSRSAVDYNYSFGGSQKYVKKHEGKETVREYDTYSKELYDQVGPLIKSIRDIETDNKEATNAYNDKVSERNEVLKEVNEAIRKAHRVNEDIQYGVITFNKFLELANNDKEVALNFFKQSEYSNYETEVLKIINQTKEVKENE